MSSPNLLNNHAPFHEPEPERPAVRPLPAEHFRIVREPEPEPELIEDEPSSFEEQIDPVEPKPKRRRVWPWLLLMLVIGLGILVAPLIYAGIEAGASAQRAKADLTLMRDQLIRGDIDGAQDSISQAKQELVTIKSSLDRIGAWRFMPWIGPQIRGLEEVQRTGMFAIEGAEKLLIAAKSLQDALVSVGVLSNVEDTGIQPSRSFQSLTRDEKRTILARLYNSLPDLRVARDKIDLAEETFSQIPQDQLFAPLRSALAPLASQLPNLRTRLDHAVSLLEVFVPLMGYPQQKQYLVLLQNSDELRATGGFIGNIGLLKVDGGDIQQFKFQDVYALDNAVIGKLKDIPPEPLQRELGQKVWYLRDSNWSPDFPQSSARISDVFARSLQLAGQPATPIDGVIALQPGFFKDLLDITGPLHVDNQTLNSSNFFDIIEYQVEQGFLTQGLSVDQRKEIVAKVGDELVKTLTNQPASQWSDVFEAVTKALEQKDMLVTVADPSLQRLLDAKEWSGRTLATPQDYLWVIDSNLAALKTDGVMDKQIQYSVDASDPANLRATVTLKYTNTNSKVDWRYTRYRVYTRVYVPEGSELISSNGAMLKDKHEAGGRIIPGPVDVYKELGKTVFGAFWALEPGETRTLTYTYKLPGTVAEALQTNKYELLVQKQPGADMRLTLDILFGKNIASAVPAEDESHFGDKSYSLDDEPIVTDQSYRVNLRP